MDQLLELVRPETAGDPMGGLFWTRRSLVKLAEALTDQGVKVSSTTVGKWLRALGYSLRVNRKRLSSSVPPGIGLQVPIRAIFFVFGYILLYFLTNSHEEGSPGQMRRLINLV